MRPCNRTRARAVRGVCGLCGLAFGSFPRPLARSSQSHLPNGGRNSCQRRLAFLMGSNRSSEQLFDFILTANPPEICIPEKSNVIKGIVHFSCHFSQSSKRAVYQIFVNREYFTSHSWSQSCPLFPPRSRHSAFSGGTKVRKE